MTPFIRSLLPLSMVCACSAYEPPPLAGTVDEIRLELVEYDEALAELRLEGTFRVEVDALEDTDAIFASVTIGTAGDYAIEPVQSEVEPLDPAEPLSLRAGESAVRSFRFSSVHRVRPSSSCWEPCDGVCAPERRFRPSVLAAVYAAAVDQEIGVYREAKEDQVLDRQPIDLGFPAATLIPDSSSASDPRPTACSGDACYFFQDNGTVAGLVRTDGTQVDKLPAGLVSTGSKLVGASAAGAVVTFDWGLGVTLQSWLPAGAAWTRTIEGTAGQDLRVATLGELVVVAAQATGGLLLDGQTVADPAAGEIALLRLDAHSSELIDVATISADSASALALRADGGVIVATPNDLVLLDADLAETQRIPGAYLSPVIHDAPGGELVVVEPFAPVRVTRLSASGAPRWEVEVPWDPWASTLVPDARGGALIATRDVVTEIDVSGATVRQVQVACGGWIALHRSYDQISLVGMISSALSVDGTIRGVDPETFAPAVVYATLTDP